MMRRCLSYLLALAALLFLFACGKEGNGPSKPTIQLTVLCDNAVKSGADGTQDGDDMYNENLISTLDIFFYPNEDTLSASAYHVRETPGSVGGKVLLLEMTSEDVNNKIFPQASSANKAYVYVVANYSGTLENKTMAELKATEVTTDFSYPANHRQASFLMDGGTSIILRGRDQVLVAQGTVRLRRHACKMTVGISVADEALWGEEVWHPVLSEMELYLVDGVKTVSLGGEVAPADYEYFSYNDNDHPLVFATWDVDAKENRFLFGKVGDYYQTDPMYMYPQHWEYGSTNPGTKEPYLKLVLSWAREENPEKNISALQKPYYYKIIIPDDVRGEDFKRRFARNNWYHIDVVVGILGTETDDEDVPVWPAQCYVKYWQDKDMVIKHADIGTARYLSVADTSYALHNVNSVSIPYTSSHPVQFYSADHPQDPITVTRPYYGNKAVGSVDTNLGGTVCEKADGSKYLSYSLAQRKALNGGQDWFSDTGQAIVMTHPLNPNFVDKKFDYSPYTMTFTLVHRDRPDDSRYREKVTIVQNPAIYIESLLNSDDSFVFLYNGSANRKIHSSDHWGYVYVDNEQLVRQGEGDISAYSDIYNGLGYTQDEYHWRVVWYTGGARDIFKINVTVLQEDSNFVIGDPRSRTIDNLRNSDDDATNDFHTAPALYDGPERSLKYYYPTDDDSERTRNMLAPSYRIASKCGGVEFGPISMDQAKWRCATYQEDGFPAGRWRLPTQGEIHFIAMLSANGSFTPLFSNSVYWSANGAVRVSNENVQAVNDAKALPRCVYDAWYWDARNDRIESKVFTWGDMPR